MIDPAQQGEQIVEKEVRDALESQLDTYEGDLTREFQVGHRWIIKIHGWTDPPTSDPEENRVFGLRITVAKYLNVGIVLGNLGF